MQQVPLKLPDVTLTLRESEVAALVQQGLRNREIAVRLGISENTVKVYLARVLISTDGASEPIRSHCILDTRERAKRWQIALNHPVERHGSGRFWRSSGSQLLRRLGLQACPFPRILTGGGCQRCHGSTDKIRG